jgi:hypothetical protein
VVPVPENEACRETGSKSRYSELFTVAAADVGEDADLVLAWALALSILTLVIKASICDRYVSLLKIAKKLVARP